MQIAIFVASLIGFLVLTLGTALFVAAEFSLTALERSAIDADVNERGDRRSRQLSRAHRTLSFQLSGAQLGITITTLITGYIAEPVLAQVFTPILKAMGASPSVTTAVSVVAALIIATSLSMVLGELIPKNIAIARPLPTARATAGAMSTFSASLSWAIRGTNGTANWIVRRLGIEPAEELRSARSPQELGSLVRNSAKEGALDAGTAILVDRSLQFGERTAEELMSPRGTVESLQHDASVLDLMRASAHTGYSRFPVAVEGDLDNIRGVVHIKQAFTIAASKRGNTSVDAIAKTVPTVPASLDGDSLMDRIRADGMQVAIVVDEYGGTAGLVTTEDLIEEIVGNVTDEHDNERADVSRSGHGWVCSGLLRIDELADATGYNAPTGEYDTLGGLVMHTLGRIGSEGDLAVLPAARAIEADIDDNVAAPTPSWQARVLTMDGRRIDTVELTPISAADSATALAQEQS